MNREIKFRAWCEKTKIMSKDFTLVQALQRKVVEHSHWDKEMLLQFTGLKDKNGVEIYEGDIVKVHLNGYSDEPCIREVIWRETGFYVSVNGGDFVTLHYRKNGIEIIGNIYQNPELLK